MRLWPRSAPGTERCRLCRRKLPATALAVRSVHQMPRDDAYRLAASKQMVCLDCLRTDEMWAAEARTRLQKRFREDCRNWLSGAPLRDPIAWPGDALAPAAAREVMALDAAVAACFEAFFYGRRGIRFNTREPAKYLPAGYHHVLRTAHDSCSFMGSIYRTPDERFFFSWDLHGASARIDN